MPRKCNGYNDSISAFWHGEEMEKHETVYHGFSEEELIEVAKQQNPKSDEDSFLHKMLMAYRILSINDI